MNPLTRLKMAIARSKLSSYSMEYDVEHPLEALIQLKVKKEFKASADFRQALGKATLGDVTREDLVQYHLHKFRRQMRYVDENAPFYQKQFKELSLRPEMIREVEDLSKVPLTEPNDLAENPFAFLCVSQSKVMRAFSTSGTSGQRKRLFYTRDDVLNIIDSIAAALRNTGMNQEDTLHIMFPAVSSWDPSIMLDGACKLAGLRSVVCSDVDIEKQLSSLKESKARVIIGLTSFIYRVTMLAREKEDLKGFGMKAIICSSEPLSEAMRREIEASWGCKALSQYGLTEMGLATAIECFAQDGIHVDEGNYMVEAVDPQSGSKLKDRQPGELIWTSLNMQGTPLLRYRSYDVSCYISPPCGCGFSVLGKICKPRGRINAETKIGFGEKVFPSLFDEVVLGVHGVLGYQLFIDKAGYRDRLTFKVEHMGDMAQGSREVQEALLALDEIRSSLDNDLLEPLVIQMVPASDGYVFKQKVIVDNRSQFDRG